MSKDYVLVLLFVKHVPDMDAGFAALEARRDKTRALKQDMMQELLAGRVRLV
jgi:hypothetical protein